MAGTAAPGRLHCRVLVVDSHSQSRKAAVGLLESCDYKVKAQTSLKPPGCLKRTVTWGMQRVVGVVPETERAAQVTAVATAKESLALLAEDPATSAFDLLLKDHHPAAGVNACRMLAKLRNSAWAALPVIGAFR